MVGETFTVNIAVDIGDGPVDGAAAYLAFDPAVLQVVNVEPGAALPELLQREVDNAAGNLAVAAGALAPVDQPHIVLAAITFQAAGAGVTSLGFLQELPQQSDVTFAGDSVLGGVESGSVQIIEQPTPTVTPTPQVLPPATPTPTATPGAPMPGESAVIQPGTGGTLQGDLGSVSTLLTLPPGAIDEPVEMNVAVVATPPATGGFKVAGQVFAITAETQNGAAVTHFRQPYTLVIHYSDADVEGIDEAALTLHYWSETQGAWIEVPGIVNTAENTLTATLDHLTVFALLEGAARQAGTLYLPAVIR